MSESIRTLRPEDFEKPAPVHAVWEITLACDLKCNHCGSRAAKKRPDELNTEEALDVVASLAALGCREVTVIGGEAYLRKDWTTIIKAIADAGMRPTMQTGARNLTQARLEAAKEAGLVAIGVSIDGLRDVHDRMRGVPGAFDKAFDALKRARELGIDISVNSQIHQEGLADLDGLFELLLENGVKTWQVQLTVAMGRAADNDQLLLQPYQLLDVMPRLFAFHQRGLQEGLLLLPGNNLGYFGPYERFWRGANEMTHWTGCNAGLNTLGIEADGTIKGCPSLPTGPYSGGNVRDMTLETIWNEAPELAFNRTRTIDELWGHCGTCYYKEVCRGGCSWTSHTLLGKVGNNPYCHYRALELQKKGLRERIEKVEEAPGRPFDYGGFRIVEEPIDAPLPKPRERRLKVIA